MTTGEHDPYRPYNPPQTDPYAGGYPPPPPPGYPAPTGYPPVPQAGWGAKPGGLGARWGARVIDGFIVLFVSFFLSFFFDSDSRIMVTGIFTGLLSFVYFTLFETTQGRTPGKMLLGMRVHGPGGAPKPDFKQSAIRNAFTLLPIIPFAGGFLGFVAMVWIALTIHSSPTKQGKHDEMAGGTQVVKG